MIFFLWVKWQCVCGVYVMCMWYRCSVYVHHVCVLCVCSTCVQCVCVVCVVSVFGTSCTIYSCFPERPPTWPHQCWISGSFRNPVSHTQPNKQEHMWKALFQCLLRCSQTAGIICFVENRGRGMAVKRKVQFVFGNQIPFPKPERAREGWAALSKGVCVRVCVRVCVCVCVCVCVGGIFH